MVIIVALGPESPALLSPIVPIGREDLSETIRFFLLGASRSLGQDNLLRNTLAPQYCRKPRSVTLLREVPCPTDLGRLQKGGLP